MGLLRATQAGAVADGGQQLVELGVNKDNIHYECFGPHKVL